MERNSLAISVFTATINCALIKLRKSVPQKEAIEKASKSECNMLFIYFFNRLTLCFALFSNRLTLCSLKSAAIK